MRRYPLSPSGRRRRRSRKWVHLISILLILAAVKAFIHRTNPAFTFSGEDRFSVATPVDEIESTAVPSVPELAPEPAPEPVPDVHLPKVPDSAPAPDPEPSPFAGEIAPGTSEAPPEIIDTRDRLNEMLSTPISRQQLQLVKEQLSELSEQWLFSRKVFPQDKLCSSYKVKLGEKLGTIGKRFKVPYEILMRINNIGNPKMLRAGETIKVINGPFHCKIYRSTFTMDLYLQDTFVRSFSVGLGRPGYETPIGRWVVKPGGKLISPTWTDPSTHKTYVADDPNYPLGSRWIALEGIEGVAKGRTGFAIHGTKNPEEIGTAGSRGCIRLHNDDAELVYDLLMPGVSQVEVVE